MKKQIRIVIDKLLVLTIILSSCTSFGQQKSSQTDKPNIVIIYLDDLGYGDLSAYGATTLKTPNIDVIANEGIKFTNAYATSATCTPSRYGMLTGVYPWRNKEAKILPGSAPLIIGENQQTLPKLLKKEGYQTGIVGKWHLGLGTGIVDWNKNVTPGPNEVGFDESYILAATQDRVPTVYIKNGLVEGLNSEDPIFVDYEKNFDGQPTGLENPELTTMKWHHGHNGTIVNGIPRIGFMKGGASAYWFDTDMADNFLVHAQNYVKNHKKNPFFLYYALNQPHVPRTPNPRFVGKSGMGPRGDAILEADWCIGEFMKTLKQEGVLENTLIIFSSDNGPVLNDGYYDDAVEKLGNHKPTGKLRGGKYSIFEAGTRVPFMTYWKGTIKPAVSEALVCQIDLLASIAKLVGRKAVTTDSQDFLNVFLGNSNKGRNNLILEATSRTALRHGDWLMIPPYKGPSYNPEVNIELGSSSEYQLYNLKNDIGQNHNLAKENKKKLEECIKIFINLRGKDYNKIEKLELK
ncbi:Arylsulfatase A [Flavobacterium flevense]|uniref:Arylsulfatase n=1 Tax=Flavobacterium flevense TaxID=983 RepID=A0A4Y4AZK0_9FLAO|nr:arylsulfatase [Flavobacterium flevense]GEC72749.1 arylsulfatase [Flavobacterium flevense]SHM16149.1 Arylsulfatase A [Flavobacterium flevense]